MNCLVDPAALNDFGLALRQIAMEVHESNPTPTPAEEPHFEAAVLALRQAAQQDRHNPTILYNLATCLATCGRHGVATEFGMRPSHCLHKTLRHSMVKQSLWLRKVSLMGPRHC